MKATAEILKLTPLFQKRPISPRFSSGKNTRQENGLYISNALARNRKNLARKHPTISYWAGCYIRGFSSILEPMLWCRSFVPLISSSIIWLLGQQFPRLLKVVPWNRY